MSDSFDIIPIKEKDFNNFHYGDVIGTDEEPKVVLLRFSPSQGVYYYCDIADFTDEAILRGYNVATVPFVKEKAKWYLFQEYPFKWGRIAAIKEGMKE